MKYIVDRPFKYCGVELQVGDEWQPRGYRVDRLIKSQRRVHEVETDAPAEQPKQRGRKVSEVPT